MGSSPAWRRVFFAFCFFFTKKRQDSSMVEHTSHNRTVGGSIPFLANNF